MPVGGLIALILSCRIAAWAFGAQDDTGWAWGLLGPVGWIIAGLRGVQDAIRERPRT